MFFQDQIKEACCGCGACSQVCAKHAITMQPDDHGFAYPSVDPELCVNCGMCEAVCPVIRKEEPSGFETRFFAVRSREEDVVRNSSSGGMFTLMAEEIFTRGGVVYGVAYGEGFRVEHERAETMQQARAFRTSKYVQSDMADLYEAVKRDLAENRTVLVTGTPCQIAGLKGVLAKSRMDTSKLYTCDNVCHGVSSPMVFADYLACLQKYVPAGDRIASVNMRYKGETGDKTVFRAETENHGPILEAADFSYHKIYQTRLVTRPSCFACTFTSYNRAGDISIGDFWNCKNGDFDFDTSHGVNEVLVSTEKGMELFRAVCEKAYWQEVSREKAWQPHLEYATQKPKTYDAFWSDYLTGDQEMVMRNYLKSSPMAKIIHAVMPILRKTGLYTFCGRLYKSVFVRKKKA